MRKAFGAILTIALVSVMVGAGTFAYLTDVESSTGNSFEAGTFDLVMTDHGPVINAEWTMDEMIPGTTWEDGQLNLYHQGSLPADHVEIEFSSICSDPAFLAGENEESDTLDGASGMSNYIKVCSMVYEDESNNNIVIVTSIPSYDWDDSYVTDKNLNGFIDLYDLEGAILDDLPAPPANPYPIENPLTNPIAGTSLTMMFSFDISAPNDYQGDECTLNLKFTLNQDASQ